MVFENLSSVLFLASSRYFISLSSPNFPALSTIFDNGFVITFKILFIKIIENIEKSTIDITHTYSNVDLLLAITCIISLEFIFFEILFIL